MQYAHPDLDGTDLKVSRCPDNFDDDSIPLILDDFCDTSVECVGAVQQRNIAAKPHRANKGAKKRGRRLCKDSPSRRCINHCSG